MAAALGLLKERIEEVKGKIKDWESKRNITLINIPDN